MDTPTPQCHAVGSLRRGETQSECISHWEMAWSHPLCALTQTVFERVTSLFPVCSTMSWFWNRKSCIPGNPQSQTIWDSWSPSEAGLAEWGGISCEVVVGSGTGSDWRRALRRPFWKKTLALALPSPAGTPWNQLQLGSACQVGVALYWQILLSPSLKTCPQSLYSAYLYQLRNCTGFGLCVGVCERKWEKVETIMSSFY